MDRGGREMRLALEGLDGGTLFLWSESGGVRCCDQYALNKMDRLTLVATLVLVKGTPVSAGLIIPIAKPFDLSECIRKFRGEKSWK